MASEDLPANGHGGPADPVASKPDLRRLHRARREAFVARLAASERDRLETALAEVLDANLPDGALAGYAAIGSEIGLARVARRFALPRVAKGAPLSFHDADGILVPAGFAAIPEPLATAPRVVPAIVLVPLLAVDRAGNRLGYGGGYYDQTLAGLRATGEVLAVGIAWEVQLTDALPAEPWDEVLDALATPDRWLACGVRPPTSPG